MRSAHRFILHDNAHTVLEGGKVRDGCRTRGRQGDLGSNFLDQGGRDDSRTSVLGLDDTKRSLVRTTNARHVAHLVAAVGGHGSQRNDGTDLVQKADVDLREFVGARNAGNERSRRVAGASVHCGQAGLSRQAVRGITTSLDARWEAHAGAGAELGHVNDVNDARGEKVALSVVNAEIRSFAGLEGEVDMRSDLEGRFQDVAAIGRRLGLVDVELGVRKLGSNLGRQSTALSTLGFNRHGHRPSTLLAFEGLLGRIVVVQEI